MAVAALKNILHEHGGAPALQQGGHEDGLTVRGKARIGRGLHRRHRPQRLCPRQAYVVRAAVHPAPGLPQRRRHRCQLPVLRVPQGDIAACGRRRAEIGGRHDPVGYHPVGAAVERAPRRYGDDRAACAPHLRAHGAQKLLQVGDLRLPRRVADHRVALCAAGGQHGVLRSAHAGRGQHDLAAPQVRRPAPQGASGVGYIRAQRPQRRQVQVDGAGPQLTAAGIAQLRPAAPRQYRP